MTSTRHVDNVARLIVLVARSEPGLAPYVDQLETAAALESRRPIRDVLLPLAAIWPVRDKVAQHADALRAWSRAHRAYVVRSMDWDPGGVAAYALRAFPKLAYALVADRSPLEDRHGAHEISGRERWATLTVLQRAIDNDKDCPFRGEEVEHLSARVVLSDPAARLLARDLLETGRAPERLREIVEAGFRAPVIEERYAALAFLFASPSEQDRALRLLVDLVKTDGASSARYELAGVFGSGRHGWGRDELGQRLRPLTQALWRDVPMKPFAKAAWPLSFLAPLFRSEKPEDEWERLRDCLAELLLDIARDAARTDRERVAALDALVPLQAGSGPSFYRALGLVNDTDEMRARAHAVRTRIKRDRDEYGKRDAELALDDAWTAYWSAAR
jgi:hypothetical protein